MSRIVRLVGGVRNDERIDARRQIRPAVLTDQNEGATSTVEPTR